MAWEGLIEPSPWGQAIIARELADVPAAPPSAKGIGRAPPREMPGFANASLLGNGYRKLGYDVACGGLVVSSSPHEVGGCDRCGFRASVWWWHRSLQLHVNSVDHEMAARARQEPSLVQRAAYARLVEIAARKGGAAR